MASVKPKTTTKKIIAAPAAPQPQKVKKAKKVQSPDQKRFRMKLLMLMGCLAILGILLSVLSYKGLI